jgi:hypothetical protein
MQAKFGDGRSLFAFRPATLQRRLRLARVPTAALGPRESRKAPDLIARSCCGRGAKSGN